MDVWCVLIFPNTRKGVIRLWIEWDTHVLTCNYQIPNLVSIQVGVWLNEHALKQVQGTIRDIVSELEQDGIDSNDGFRKVYQGGY